MSASAIRAGLRAGRNNLGATVWLYLGSLLSAFPLALGLGWLVQQSYGASLEAESFARLDVVLIGEFLRERSTALRMLAPIMGGAAVFWALMSAYLGGAVISAVGHEVPLRTNEFFSAGGRVFSRLLRLMALGVPFSLLLVGLPAAGIWKLVSVIIEDLTSDVGVLLIRLSAVLLTLLIVAWVNCAYDFMKVEAVTKGEYRARFAFIRGLARAIKHPIGLLSVYLPFVVAGVLLTVVVSLVDVRIERASWGLIALGFIVQQCTTFARAWLRVALAGAEVAYVRAESLGAG